MKYAIGILAIFGFLFGSTPSPAQAPTPCAPMKELVDTLFDRFGEVATGMGVSASGDFLVILFLNPATGSWTIVMRGADSDVGCIPATGDGWQEPTNDLTAGESS